MRAVEHPQLVFSCPAPGQLSANFCLSRPSPLARTLPFTVHRSPFTIGATRQPFYVNEAKSDSQTTIHTKLFLSLLKKLGIVFIIFLVNSDSDFAFSSSTVVCPFSSMKFLSVLESASIASLIPS